MHFHTNVWSITQKRMIPKCSNLVLGMILGYPRNDVVLGFQGHRLRLGLRQEKYGVGSNSMSAFLLTLLSFCVNTVTIKKSEA